MGSVFDPIFAPIASHKRVRKGGGWRAVAAREVANQDRERDRVPQRRQCRKGMGHLRDWSRGKVSAPHWWGHIANAVADDIADKITSHPLLLRLHGCGVSERDQNIHHRLIKLLLDTCHFRDLQHQPYAGA